MRHRSINRNSAVASGSSFFNGWRSTPGTTPLTSQLVLLISTITTKVEIGSNAARLRLRSLTCSTVQPPSVRMDDEGATTSAAPPHSFSYVGSKRQMLAACAPKPVTRFIRFFARHVLCWPAFPLVAALCSTDSAACAPADASAAGSFALFAGAYDRALAGILTSRIRQSASLTRRLFLLYLIQ